MISFKDELAKRRKASAEEQAKKEDDRKQHLAAIREEVDTLTEASIKAQEFFT
jgi:hypothetical protein